MEEHPVCYLLGGPCQTNVFWCLNLKPVLYAPLNNGLLTEYLAFHSGSTNICFQINWKLRNHARSIQPFTSLFNVECELLCEKIMSHHRQMFLCCHCFTADSWCVWREKCTGRLLTCSETPLRAADREAHNDGTTEDAKEIDVTRATQWPSSDGILNPANLLVRMSPYHKQGRDFRMQSYSQ